MALVRRYPDDEANGESGGVREAVLSPITAGDKAASARDPKRKWDRESKPGRSDSGRGDQCTPLIRIRERPISAI